MQVAHHGVLPLTLLHPALYGAHLLVLVHQLATSLTL